MIGAAIAEAVVRVRADTTQFRAETLAGVRGAMGGAAGGFNVGTASMLKFGAAATGVAAGVQILHGALTEVIHGTGEFEQTMNVLQVVSGATEEQMKSLAETAKDLGSDVTLPGISAGDAATAMNELAKAGLNVDQTMNGAKGVLQLAAAGEMDVRDAAALAAGALNAFGLSGGKATHVADLLAGASIAAQGDVSDMGLALSQSSAVARQAGLTIEQTVGAIGLLAKNGILGSDAGTSLRTTLLKLIPTTKEATQFTKALGIQFDKNRTLGEQLPSLIEQYHQALSKLPPALQQTALTQIFGTDAIRAASILFREGAAGYQQMTDAANRNGAANELATAKTKGMLGQFEALKSSLSGLAIEIGGVVTPAITGFLTELAAGTSQVTDFIREVKKVGDIEIPDILDPSEQDDTTGNDAAKEIGKRWGKLAAKQFTGVFESGVDLAHQVFQMSSGREVTEQLLGGGFETAADKAAVGVQAQMEGLGKKMMDATAKGIKDNTQSPVDEAKAMVKQVAEQGRKAVRDAIAGAQQNLASIGASLAGDAGTIIDAEVAAVVDKATAKAAATARAAQSKRQRDTLVEAQAALAQGIKNVPIMREIERLQKQLDAENRASARTDVRRGLRDAKEALALAKESVLTTGLDPRQRAATARFLRPLTEGVTDAQGAVKKFNTETRLDVLQKKLDGQTDDITENLNNLRDAVQDARDAIVKSQASFATEGLANSLKEAGNKSKTAVKQGIDDAINEFNKGLISLPELNRKIAKLLEDNKVDYQNAGALLGTAFVDSFNAKVKGITTQGAAIKAGPFEPGAGLRPNIVAPAVIAATANLNNQEAQRKLQEAMVEFDEQQLDALVDINNTLQGRTGKAETTRSVTGGSSSDIPSAATLGSASNPITFKRNATSPASPRAITRPVVPFRPGRVSGP